MSLGYGVVQLDVTIVNTALSSIGNSLGGGVAELQWVVSAYTIAFAAFILTAGALGDRIGAKRVFMAGFAIFTAASVACGLAPDAWTLIAARAVQGLGAAILVPNSLALLSHAYPDDKSRGRAVGIWAAGASLTLTAGPLVGGSLIALVGWRWIFFVNLPIGLLGLWLTWRFASETTRAPQRELDLPGQVAAIAALGCLAGAIIEGGAIGWRNPFVIAGFAASAVLAVLFVLQRTPRAATDAAAVAVRQSHVLGRRDGGTARQRRLLRADLRVQPLLPAHQQLVAIHDRPRLPADARRGAADQSAGAASGGADRRAADHCAGFVHRRRRQPRPADRSRPARAIGRWACSWSRSAAGSACWCRP